MHLPPLTPPRQGHSTLAVNVINTLHPSPKPTPPLTPPTAPHQGHSAFIVNLVNALFGVGALCAPLLAELCIKLGGSTLLAYPATAALTAASGLVFLLLPSPASPKAVAVAAAAAAAAGPADEEAREPLLAVAEDGGENGGVKPEDANGGGRGSGGGNGGAAADPWALFGPLAHVLWPVSTGIWLGGLIKHCGLVKHYCAGQTIQAVQRVWRSRCCTANWSS